MSKMRIRKIIWGFFCVCLVLTATVLPANTARAEQWNRIPEIMQENEENKTAADPPADISLYATAAVLMDADSGRVLYGKNADTVMAMASTTKIMTCILVLEHASLEDVLTVSSYAASMPKVKLNVQNGEQYTVRDLLYSLMLESHNDTAVALAEYVGKQFLDPELRAKDTADYTVEESKQAVAAFAALMNEKAASLGCENTWFITPNGLDATENILLADGSTAPKEHCTTAKELAGILAYCIRQSSRRDVFLEITRTSAYSFSANGRSYSCVNHNAFLTMMDGALTGKTGFTNKAGYCYVGALERDGRTFVVALLACGWPNNKSYKWSDTRKLMEYGVENYFYRSFSGSGMAFDETLLKAVPVHNGRTKVLGATAYVNIGIAERESGQQAGYADLGEGAVLGEGTVPGENAVSGEGTVSGEETVPGDDVIPDEGHASSDGFASGNGGSQWKEGLLLRADEEIKVDYSWKKELTAPVTRGTVVGSIDYVVDGVVYKRETIITIEDVAEIDLKWCLCQVLDRFLLTPMSYLCLPVNAL